jgi:hypothetical protein
VPLRIDIPLPRRIDGETIPGPGFRIDGYAPQRLSQSNLRDRMARFMARKFFGGEPTVNVPTIGTLTIHNRLRRR